MTYTKRVRFPRPATDMVHVLRILLIGFAVAAQLVAGLPASVAESPAAVWIPAGPSPFDDHREDDAGTTAEQTEQAEQDDTDEEEVRNLPPLHDSAADHAADHLRQTAHMQACPRAAGPVVRGHSSRGPPA